MALFYWPCKRLFSTGWKNVVDGRAGRGLTVVRFPISGAMTLQQTQAERVVGKFGGLDQMARDTEHPYKRIWNWLRSEGGFIPQSYHQGLLDEAVRLGVDLHPYDFVAHLHRPVAVSADLQATG